MKRAAIAAAVLAAAVLVFRQAVIRDLRKHTILI